MVRLHGNEKPWKFDQLRDKKSGCTTLNSDWINYKAISVVCHVAKIIEKEVQVQLIDYLNTHDIFSVDQFAFLKNHSTQSCLHRVIDDFYEALNEHEVVGSCFLDISKFFDTIDHDLLLFKLDQHGILGNELKWFKSYIFNRKQVVRCNGEVSGQNDISVGVPQGSVLGPILFFTLRQWHHTKCWFQVHL